MHQVFVYGQPVDDLHFHALLPEGVDNFLFSRFVQVMVLHQRIEVCSPLADVVLQLDGIQLRSPKLLEFISRELCDDKSLLDAQFVVLGLRVEPVVVDVRRVAMGMVRRYDVSKLQKGGGFLGVPI